MEASQWDSGTELEDGNIYIDLCNCGQKQQSAAPVISYQI